MLLVLSSLRNRDSGSSTGILCLILMCDIFRARIKDNSVILARVISRLLHFFELFPVTDDVAKFFNQAQPATIDVTLLIGSIDTRYIVTFTGKSE